MLLGGCSAPSKGALVLAVSTDMQTPKDIDVVSIYITTNGGPRFNYMGRVRPDGTVALPSTLAIVEPDQQGAQIRIRVIAFQTQSSGDANARVLRDVLTTVPHQRTALLRVPLDFLDYGSGNGTLPAKYVPLGPGGASEGDTAFDPTTIASACNFEQSQQTMVNGVCTGAAVDSSTLPTYSPSEVYADGAPLANGVVTACFDVATCLAGATPVKNVNTSTCSFPLAPGGSAPANLALVTQTTGACLAPGQCFVPLENDPAEGWTASGGTVQMIPAICTALASGAQLYEATVGCAALTVSQPVCEPTSQDGGAEPGTEAGEDSAVETSSEAGADATLGTTDANMDGSVDDATLGSPDANGGGPDATAASLDAGEGGGACLSPMLTCSGQCVDPTIDNSNCGGCGVACNGTCTFGRCKVLLMSGINNKPLGITRDATNIYWTDTGTGAVMKAPIGGGTPTTLATDPDSPSNIVVDSNNVYWMRQGAGGVISVPITGGTPTTHTASATTIWSPVSAFAIDTSSVYWIYSSGATSASSPCPDGGVCTVVAQQPLAGGAIATLATAPGQPVGIAVDGQAVYCITYDGTTSWVQSVPLGGGTPSTLASRPYSASGTLLAGGNIYWVEGGAATFVSIDGGTPTQLHNGYIDGPFFVDNGYLYSGSQGTVPAQTIAKQPLDGGASTTIESNLPNVAGLAADSTSVYWTSDQAATVLSASLDGGTPTTLASGANGLTSIALDSSYAYVAFSSGSILRVQLAGGTPTTFASGQPTSNGAQELAIDSNDLYWTDQFHGAVLKESLTGGSPVTVYSGGESPITLAVDSSRVYWTTSPGGTVSSASLDGGGYTQLANPGATYSGAYLEPMVVTQTNIYWCESATGFQAIVSMPLDGGTITTVASGYGALVAAPGDMSIYWNTGTPAVMESPSDGGVALQLPASALPTSMAVDALNFYYVDNYYTVRKIPLSGGTPTTLATPQTGASKLTVDSTSVYWMEGAGTLARLTPK
jgi:hypothetical protein